MYNSWDILETLQNRRRGTSYHFGPVLMISTSLLLNAVVSAGIADGAKRAASSVISLLRAILKETATAQKDRIFANGNLKQEISDGGGLRSSVQMRGAEFPKLTS
jgi:hypothetical protein